MSTPARTTNHRGAKKTRVTIKHEHTADPKVLEIATTLATAIAKFIDAHAAEQRSKTSMEQTKFTKECLPTAYCLRCFGPFKVATPQMHERTKGLCGPCFSKMAMRTRIFELIAPKIRTVGGMAPLGKQYVEVEGEDPCPE